MLTTVHEAITHIQATVKRRLDGTRQDVNCPPLFARLPAIHERCGPW